jgi:ADP-L-glycero-D-manno-heptose 6-epimerase
MIVVTGGAGFIGSAIVWRLNQLGNDNILIVDELGTDEKWKNLTSLKFADYMNKWEFLDKIESEADFNIEAIIHMGANSSTTEKDADHLIENNYEYTKALAHYILLRKMLDLSMRLLQPLMEMVLWDLQIMKMV